MTNREQETERREQALASMMRTTGEAPRADDVADEARLGRTPAELSATAEVGDEAEADEDADGSPSRPGPPPSDQR